MSSDKAQAPHAAIIPQPVATIKECTDIVLPDDVWSVIATFVDWRGFQALACASKMTRDAAYDVDWLARDKVYVMRCWLALGGKEDTLTRGYWDDGVKMRDEPSDDLSEWLGVRMGTVTVEERRVTELYWLIESLTGTIPAEIGALDGLKWLNLAGNQICGHLPSEIGRLTSLKELSLNNNRLEGPLPAELGALTALITLTLSCNSFTGEIPSTLANLTNLETLSLVRNNFDTDVPSDLVEDEEAQAYLATLRAEDVITAENEEPKAKIEDCDAKIDELKARIEELKANL